MSDNIDETVLNVLLADDSIPPAVALAASVNDPQPASPASRYVVWIAAIVALAAALLFLAL